MEFLKSVLSNDDGTGSSNRVGLIIVVLALIVWSTIVVYRTGTIPDISSTWLGIIGVFVGGTSFGKATDAVRDIKAPAQSEILDAIPSDPP